MQPFDASQVKPPRRSVGRMLLLVLLGTIGVACCLPGGGYAAWYLALDTGPHTSLPSVCTAMDGAAFRTIVEQTEGRRSDVPTNDDLPRESCFWSGERTPTRTGLVLSATLYKRSPIASSVDEAREVFETARETLARRAGYAAGTDRKLTGVGQEGWCMAEADNPSNSDYECVARDGNVILRATVDPPSTGATPPGIPHLTRQGTSEALDRFMAEIAPALFRDYIDDL